MIFDFIWKKCSSLSYSSFISICNI
jgi:hypothetical protein